MIYNLRFKNKFAVFLSFFLLLTSYYLLLPSVARAVCPICTVAVGAGLGLSRWLGIDDAVSSIWIGGLILSSSFWLIDWMYKKYPSQLKKYKNSTVSYFTIAAMYAFVILPLWFGKIIGHPFNTILGIDKIVFGTAVGSVVFLFGMWTDKKVRKIKGRQLFQYQKVVFPVASLVITSLLLYYYGGYLY